MQALTTTVARVLFALPFGIFGLLHFMGGQNMAGMVPAWIPGGVFWVYLTGLAHIAATVSIIAQKKARLASLLLAAMLGVFVLTIHLPGIFGATDEMGRMMSMSGFLKDVALAGGALAFAGLAKD
jgi:uncharacterized membrane protein YphA (DoxX/SURF4 family)